MTRQEFSNQLVAARESVGYSKNAMMFKCGFTSHAVVDRIESAQVNYSFVNVFKYLHALNAYMMLKIADRTMAIKEYDDTTPTMITVRKLLKVTKYSLAKEAGVSWPSIHDAESNKKVWHIDFILSIINALGVQIQIVRDE